MHTHRGRTTNTAGNSAPDLTPMIDVVFQLLVFFLVTLRPEDILAHLDVLRPQAGDGGAAIRVVDIGVYADRTTLNDRRVTPEQLQGFLHRLGSYDTHQAVTVSCAPDAAHQRLIQVLNDCEHAGLRDIALLSR